MTVTPVRVAFDKCGELVLGPIIFLLAGGPYFAFYFFENFDEPAQLSLQILAATASIITNSLSQMLIAKHAPSAGVGKIYAVRSLITTIFSLGFGYLTGWMIDQSYSKYVFFVIGTTGLLIVLLFLFVAIFCPKITKVN